MELEMRKICNQWKIFFSSTNLPKTNLANMGLFMFNNLLSLFYGSLKLIWGESSFPLFLSFIWLELSLLWFLRLYYNQATPRFSKTLPCTKKLYTKYISISFEVINSLPLVEWLILWGIFGLLGKDVSRFRIMFLFISVIHLILSVGMPFITTILSQEEKMNSYGGIRKMGTTIKLLSYEFLLMGSFGGLSLLSRFLSENAEYINQIPWCVGILIFSCLLLISFILNRMIFNKLYRRN